ncbi:MAG: hypothetical protein OXH93_15440, partial [Caldilineaceae bacterium]|nr:hypothetical protein [Caldilineaceae bacterium]
MAEVNQAWLERVNRARESAAERLGVDVSEMLPPRDGTTGEAADSAPAPETAAPQPEPAAVAAQSAPEPAPQPEPAAVAEAEPVAAAEVAPVAEAPA